MFTLEDIEKIVLSVRPLIIDRKMASHVKTKGRADFVTEVDMTVQKTIKAKLDEIAPEVEFLGEETGLQAISGDRYWILDPIDGTSNLIHDYHRSAVSLALCDHGEIVMGIVYNPYQDEMFTAEKGKGAYLNGEPIHVTETEQVFNSLIAVGTAPYHREKLGEKMLSQVRKIFLACEDIRRCGSAAIDLAYVAAGRTDGFFEPILQPWDYAAGMLLVTEAGGRVTGEHGEQLDLTEPHYVAASNGLIHDEMLNIIS